MTLECSQKVTATPFEPCMSIIYTNMYGEGAQLKLDSIYTNVQRFVLQ